MKIVQTLFTKWMGFRTFFFCLEINLFHQIFFFKFCRAFRNWLHEEKNFGLMAYVWNFFVLLCCISRYLFFHNSLFGLSFLCISTLEPWLRKWRGREWPAHGLPIFHFTTMLTSFIIFRTIRIKVKFRFSKKATKFEKSPTWFDVYIVNVKPSGRLFVRIWLAWLVSIFLSIMLLHNLKVPRNQ